MGSGAKASNEEVTVGVVFGVGNAILVIQERVALLRSASSRERDDLPPIRSTNPMLSDPQQ